MLLRIVQFVLGALLAGGGGYLAWTHRAGAMNVFPPGAEGMPWLVIAGVLGLSAGVTLLVTGGDVVTMNANAGPVTSVGGESLRRQATVTVDAIKPTVTLSKTPDEEDGEFILVGGSTSFELNVTNTSTVSATSPPCSSGDSG